MRQTLPKICLAFIIGILAGYLNLAPLWATFCISLGFLAVFVFYFFKMKKSWLPGISFGMITFLLFVFLGTLTVQLHYPKNQSTHYINSASIEAEVVVQARITETLKPDLYNEKFVATVQTIGDKAVTGKILVLKPKNVSASLSVDDDLVFFSSLDETPKPLNPYQFDYREHLAKKGILKQVALRQSNFFVLKNPQVSAKGLAEEARKKIISELKENNFRNDELAIIQALLLGERKDVSKEIYSSYANAGVIHILAVSGLHVGIILLIISWLLTPVKKLKHGKIIHLFMIIFFLWSFAFLAGLSASIIRAVTMFTFMAIGLQLNRKGNISNSVAASMLILLLANPFYLFEIGFQLSYAAVISIVVFQPLLSNFLKSKNRLPKYLWNIFTVTLTAQIGVLPLSLYYFHQFPGLFFISNLIILPFLGIVLGFGIMVIVLALLNLLPEFVSVLFETTISYLNGFVQFIAMQEDFLFKNIPFSLLLCLFSYLIVAFFYLYLKKPNHLRLKNFVIAVIILQVVLLFEKQKNNALELLVFNQSKNSSIGFRNGEHLTLYSTMDQPEKAGFIQDFKVGNKISQIYSRPFQKIVIFQNEKMLVIDSAGIYQLPDFAPDYLLLCNSPNINLDRVIEDLNPKAIIADGSNYPTDIRRWKKTSENKKAPFHYTREKGAFIVEY